MDRWRIRPFAALGRIGHGKDYRLGGSLGFFVARVVGDELGVVAEESSYESYARVATTLRGVPLMYSVVVISATLPIQPLTPDAESG